MSSSNIPLPESQPPAPAGPNVAIEQPATPPSEPDPISVTVPPPLPQAPIPHWLQILGIVAGIGYAVVTFFMWRDNGHAIEDNRNAIQDVHNNFVLGERAWVLLDKAELPPEADIKEAKPIAATLTIKNTGKTPTKRLTSMWDIEIPRATEAVQFNYTHNNVGLVPMLGPDKPYEHRAERTADAFHSVPLTKDEAEDLLAGRLYVAAYGTIVYFDMFGQLHWLRVCGWRAYHQNSFNSISCTKYNDFGDGPPPGPPLDKP